MDGLSSSLSFDNREGMMAGMISLGVDGYISVLRVTVMASAIMRCLHDTMLLSHSSHKKDDSVTKIRPDWKFA